MMLTRFRTAPKVLLFVPLLGSQAHAHVGDGLLGVAHWHASDAAGVLLTLLAVCVLVWSRRR